jgi:hypothetical protein
MASSTHLAIDCGKALHTASALTGLSCAGIIQPGMRFDYAYRAGVSDSGDFILRLDVRIMPPHHDPPLTLYAFPSPSDYL